MGLTKWLKDCRPLSGTVRDWLRGPCHQFEIDATIADIYLVNSYSRRMLIGRPVVYIVVDSFSGMIVGLYVGLEGPSWNGARQALFNAFTSKVEFCAQNGVDITPEDWDCRHLPHQIYADRGEMLGAAAEGLASGLGIDMGTAPPYRPDWKPMVESRFGILNDLTGIRWLPGGVAAREKERGERDYRLDATLNLKEFTQVLIECILHYNRFHRQPDRLTQAMMNDGVEPTPMGIWRWALENDLIQPNKRPDELIYLNLLPRERATVQKGGVLFRGMHYLCEMAIEKNWFAKARRNGVWAIDCWFDPNSAAHIWIRTRTRSSCVATCGGRMRSMRIIARTRSTTSWRPTGKCRQLTNELNGKAKLAWSIKLSKLSAMQWPRKSLNPQPALRLKQWLISARIVRKSGYWSESKRLYLTVYVRIPFNLMLRALPLSESRTLGRAPRRLSIYSKEFARGSPNERC
ncbi:Tn7-like transposition protein B [Pseudomonas aeruginosa PADK2_CF510]|nr:Tn7-like transposition protein B [Pseudomonas aeruginosa PADK2_CF510]